MNARNLAVALALALASGAPVAFALARAERAETPLQRYEIALGRSALGAGTIDMFEIVPSAIPTCGPNGSGALGNRVPHGFPLVGLDFAIELGNARSIEIDARHTAVFDEHGRASLRVPANFGRAADAWVPYRVHEFRAPADGPNLLFRVTPAFVFESGASAPEFNVLPECRLDALTPSVTSRIAELHRATALVSLVNADPARKLESIELSAQLELPGLVDVRLVDAAGRLVPGPRAALGTEGRASLHLVPLAPAQARNLLLVFERNPGGKPLELRIEPRFAD